MKKLVNPIIFSYKKEASYKQRAMAKPFAKPKKIPVVGKHRITSSGLTQSNADNNRTIFTKSFCATNKNVKDKKNTVLFIHPDNRKLSEHEETQNLTKREEVIKETINNNKEIEESPCEENGKIIDYLQNKMNMLFGVIEDFEKQYMKTNPVINTKDELSTIKKYTFESMSLRESSNNTNNPRLNTSTTNKTKNKSVNFSTKTTMENSILVQKKNKEKTDKKEKTAKSKINCYKKKTETKNVFTPPKKSGNAIHNKYKKGMINSTSQQKNNSLCYSERTGNKRINKIKELNNEKEESTEKFVDKTTIRKTNASPCKNGHMKKIYFPESVNDEEKCKTERKK